MPDPVVNDGPSNDGLSINSARNLDDAHDQMIDKSSLPILLNIAKDMFVRSSKSLISFFPNSTTVEKGKYSKCFYQTLGIGGTIAAHSVLTGVLASPVGWGITGAVALVILGHALNEGYKEYKKEGKDSGDLFNTVFQTLYEDLKPALLLNVGFGFGYAVHAVCHAIGYAKNIHEGLTIGMMLLFASKLKS